MKPKLFEALMQQPNSEQRQLYEQLKQKVEHPFIKRYVQMGIKEGFFSDVVHALGRMHDTLVPAAWPALIGRSIIKVMPTTEAMERFPLDVDAVAYEYAEGAKTRLSGKKVATVDINTDVLADASEEWTREFLEDATWNVLNNAVTKIGKAVGQKETEKIIALYAGIADADLATGAVLAGGGTVMNWTKLLSLWYAVKSEKWLADVLAINDMQMAQLLNDSTFTNAQYLQAGETDLDSGVVSSALGMNIVSSPLIPNGTAYAIDRSVAAVMLLRRDAAVQDWEDVKTGKYGVRATTRFGLGVLRANAVAKMTNIKTTLT
ncbi:MAG: phage major capsid protein [Candidatus Bathyarchaeota archaeon]|nr:phage major capsid protein [Candidatus Bathyarchaeota archaeon]